VFSDAKLGSTEVKLKKIQRTVARGMRPSSLNMAKSHFFHGNQSIAMDPRGLVSPNKKILKKKPK